MMLLWTGFIALILLLLALDLGIFHRAAHVVTVKEALKWSVVWVTVGLSFSIPIYFAYENHWLDLGTTVDAIDHTVNDGRAAAGKYLTGYIVEQSLSVDNLFVIAMIFSAFAVPAIYQHRLLFWGIIGALAMRGAMIGIGAQLVSRFHWILFLFGAFLIVTSVKMLATKSAHAVPSNGAIIRIARRFFPVTDRYHGNHFLVRAGSANSKEGTPGIAVPFEDAAVARAKTGAWMLTPLAIALLTIETTDLIFAVDSIPAIFAITADPFLVFSSNIFAILGLRSLFFVLAGMLDKFRYLKYSLAAILFLVGAKMFVADWVKSIVGDQFNLYLLIVIFAILAVGVLASFQADRRDHRSNPR